MFKTNGSIRGRITWVMFIVIFIQAILFFSVIYVSDVFTNMDENVVNLINLTVKNRTDSFYSAISSQRTDLNKIVNDCNSIIKNELNLSKLTFNEINNNPQIINRILDNSMPTLVSLMKTEKITGTFLILDTTAGGSLDKNNSKSGIYIRDKDIFSANTDKNSDLILVTGPKSIANLHEIPVGEDWQEELTLSNDSDYFNMPIEAAQISSNSDIADLGYWGSPFTKSGYSYKAITYSVPLLDNLGNIYGVVGFEYSSDYIKTLIPDNELTDDDNNTYVIFKEDGNKDVKITNIFSGKSLPSINYDNIKEKISNRQFNYDNPNVYIINFGENSSDLFAFRYQIPLYSDSSHFKEEQWFLTGIVEESDIIHLSSDMLKLILTSLGISVFLAAIFAIFGSRAVTSPILKLTKSVKKMDFTKISILQRTKIQEIDELAGIIEAFNKSSYETARKISKIIDLMNVPIATFEKKVGSNSVFVTKSIANLLSINPAILIDDYIPLDLWNELFSKLTSSSNLSYDGSFHIGRGTESEKWILVKTFTNTETEVGVLLDITGEIKERMKLEYERDYDSLTGILNRRAFYAMTDQVLLEENVSCGVMGMWDLDGLKSVNDQYGHQIGDRYIQEAAEIFDSISDVSHAFVARLSGDEFVTFIFGNGDVEEYKKELYDLSDTFRNTYLLLPNGDKIKLSASAGITVFPDHADNCKELIRRADFAMYKVKDSTKDGIWEFNEASFEMIDNSEIIVDNNNQ